MLTIFRERYEVIETLGEGGEAQILKALDRQHDRFVALKVRRVRDDADRDELLHEARMLLALPPHPANPIRWQDKPGDSLESAGRNLVAWSAVSVQRSPAENPLFLCLPLG